jgi:hypothetical protein
MQRSKTFHSNDAGCGSKPFAAGVLFPYPRPLQNLTNQVLGVRKLACAFCTFIGIETKAQAPLAHSKVILFTKYDVIHDST